MSTRLFWIFALSCIPLSGCRFGNYIQQAPAPVAVNYYETSPQTVTFCATVSPTASQSCKAGTLYQIPSTISGIMTNPVALRIDNATQQGSLIGLFGNNPRIPTTLDSDGTLSFDGTTPPNPLWLDSACTTQLHVIERDGKVLSNANAGSVTVSGTPIPVKGRIQLSFDVIRAFETTACASSLQAMHDCYVDSNQCGGTTARENTDLQSVVQSYFSDFIEAGVMTSSDIPTVTQVSYSVSYR